MSFQNRLAWFQEVGVSGSRGGSPARGVDNTGMAATVDHPNPTIKSLALQIIADLEKAVPVRFGNYRLDIKIHDYKWTPESDLSTKRRLTIEAKTA